jgi:translation initiation factor 3 subunit F
MEYHQTMLELHQKVSPKDVIVGWYATGNRIDENSVIIHDFYWKEMQNASPVHLLVNTDLSKLKFEVLTYNNVNVILNENPLGSQFLEIPNEITGMRADRIGGSFYYISVFNFFS